MYIKKLTFIVFGFLMYSNILNASDEGRIVGEESQEAAEASYRERENLLENVRILLLYDMPLVDFFRQELLNFKVKDTNDQNGQMRPLFTSEDELFQESVACLTKLTEQFEEIYKMKMGRATSSYHKKTFKGMLVDSFVQDKLLGFSPNDFFRIGRNLVRLYVGSVLTGFSPKNKIEMGELAQEAEYEALGFLTSALFQKNQMLMAQLLLKFHNIHLDIQYNYKLKHRDEDLNLNLYENEACPLCLELFKPGQNVYRCQNGHIAHAEKESDEATGTIVCEGARTWVCGSLNSCPTCRESNVFSIHQLTE